MQHEQVLPAFLSHIFTTFLISKHFTLKNEINNVLSAPLLYFS